MLHRYTLAAGLVFAVLLPVTAPAQELATAQQERLIALFQTAEDASLGKEIEGAEVAMADGYIITGPPACEIMEILNADDSCEVTAVLIPPEGLGLDSLNYFKPVEIGHVDMQEWTDEVSADIDTIWQSYVEGTREQSEKLGFTIEPLGWALYPTLDKKSGVMSYGIRVNWGGEELINLMTVKFTREGFALIRVVTDPERMRAAGHDYATLAVNAADTYKPLEGFRYADYTTGDKVAEIGALGVLASVMGVNYAKKSGWLAALLGGAALILKKFWFLVLAIPVALWAGVRRLFSRRS